MDADDDRDAVEVCGVDVACTGSVGSLRLPLVSAVWRCGLHGGAAGSARLPPVLGCTENITVGDQAAVKVCPDHLIPWLSPDHLIP